MIKVNPKYKVKLGFEIYFIWDLSLVPFSLKWGVVE